MVSIHQENNTAQMLFLLL